MICPLRLLSAWSQGLTCGLLVTELLLFYIGQMDQAPAASLAPPSLARPCRKQQLHPRCDLLVF
jgi:hypothetical protein